MEKSLQQLLEEAMGKPKSSLYGRSDYQREVASKTHKGKTISAEHYAKMEEGRKKFFDIYEFSEQHKVNQSEAAKKRWEDNPYIATPEVGKKRSKSLKKYWAEKKANMPAKEVEPPKKRGRPKTRTLPDPTLPKRGRGRPPKVSSH